MLPEVALIAAVPTLRVVATPPEVIVATPEFDEVQVTEVVRFCALPSVYVPVATYWTIVPTFTDWFAGVTAIDTNTAAPTVSPPAVMVATPVFDEIHVAELVTSNVDPSE